MDTFLSDLRGAARLLATERTFSATVLLTLAVCLGANVAIFSVVHAVLLKPLPFAAAERLVTVFNSYPAAGAARASNGTVDFFQRRENVAAFREVALYQGSGSTVGEAGGTERVSTLRVTPSFFPLLGVEAARGRTFTEDEMEEGRHRKVVLTHAFWQERFGGRPAVGRDLRIDGQPYTVVGVLGEDFAVPGRPDARFFVPVAFDEGDRALERWHSNDFEMVARLAPGATVEQARAQILALNEALMDRWPVPNGRQLLQDAGYTVGVVPLEEDLVRDVRPILYLLWAGVAFVLLIGCVNVANLMLARAERRTAEMATRLALGASRARVARQVLTEAVVLGVAGGLLGTGLGWAGLRLLLGLGADRMPRGTEVAVDPPVLLFTLALAVGTGLAFGAIPLVKLLGRDLSPVFRAESRTGTASRRAVLLRNGLVTAQVGLAFVLLVGAGLMLVSFRSALAVEPGFEADGVLTAQVSLPSARYEGEDARRLFWDELLRETRALPGVESAGITAQLPFNGQYSSSVAFPEGYVPSPGESVLSPFQTRAGPGYFEAMGIEVVEGRGFRESDDPDAPRVLVIDRWLADRYWPDGGALGARMAVEAVPGADSIPESALWTVVGVVETIKQNDLTAPEAEHVGAYYFTYRQRPPSAAVLAVRAVDGEPAALAPALRRTLARLDPELPLFGVETMRHRVDESLVRRRIPLVLLGVFGGVALFLASVGIYGALSWAVSQRRREIGVRMAMGSAPADVFRDVVGRGLRVTGLGLVMGAGAAFLLTRLIRSLLFGVEPVEPLLTLAVAAVLGSVALVACVVPARRATGVDPVEALTG